MSTPANNDRRHSFPGDAAAAADSRNKKPRLASSSSSRNSSSSIVEDWLRGDVRTPWIVLSYLPWKNIRRLLATCSTWRAYIYSANLHHPMTHTVSLPPRLLQYAATSQWLPLICKGLRVTFAKEYEGAAADDPEDCAEEFRTSFDSFRTYCPSFSRICVLELLLNLHHLTTEFIDIVAQLPNLQTLLLVDNFGCFTPISFRNLDSLQSQLRKVRFTSLRNCEHLSTFSVDFRTRINVGFYCSADQVQDLLQCRSLTKLNCGTWVGSHVRAWDFGRLHPQRVSQGLALLSQLPLLQDLELNGHDYGKVSREDWKYLRQITTLTRLVPTKAGWDDEINEEWQYLPSLTNLNTFGSLQERTSRSVPQNPSLISAVIRTPTITSLRLGEVRLTDEDLTSIFTCLSRLRELHLNCQLQSCRSFQQAPGSLRSLKLECRQFNGKIFYYHLCLPVIPSLTYLIIQDDWVYGDWPQEMMSDFGTIVANEFESKLRSNMPNIQNRRIYTQVHPEAWNGDEEESIEDDEYSSEYEEDGSEYEEDGSEAEDEYANSEDFGE